jgi:predicted nucleic acid-binding protein
MMGQTLFLEYEDVLGRKDLFRNSPLSLLEREHLLDAFLSVCEWVQVYYLWRPNLADEADNHILELAIAGNASAIVTNNLADFRHAELRFPEIQVVTPKQFLEKLT